MAPPKVRPGPGRGHKNRNYTVGKRPTARPGRFFFPRRPPPPPLQWPDPAGSSTRFLITPPDEREPQTSLRTQPTPPTPACPLSLIVRTVPPPPPPPPYSPPYALMPPSTHPVSMTHCGQLFPPFPGPPDLVVAAR